MPLLLLIRHGENEYVKTGKLAGRLPGVHLNEKGQKQAQALGEALRDVPIKAIYSSPLERAMETASPIAESHKLTIIQRIRSHGYGYWQMAGQVAEDVAADKGLEDRTECAIAFSFPGRRVVSGMSDAHHEHPGADHPKAPQAAGHCGGSLSRGPDQAGDLTFSGHAARSLSTPELRHRFIDCAARGRRQRKFDQVKSTPAVRFFTKR